MAIIDSSKIKSDLHSGEYGNLSKEVVTTVLSSAAIADVVRVIKVPAGSIVTGVDFRSDGLGVGVTVSLGYDYADSSGGAPAQFLAATSAAAATNTGQSNVRALSVDKDIYITATIGGAAANGSLDVSVEYIFNNI